MRVENGEEEMRSECNERRDAKERRERGKGKKDIKREGDGRG